MYYILLRILIPIIIAYLFVVFLFTGFSALVTHETLGLLFVAIFLMAIVLGVVFSSELLGNKLPSFLFRPLLH